MRLTTLPASVTIYKNNNNTTEIDGMQEGEQFTFRILEYSSPGGYNMSEFDAKAIYTSAESTFRDGAVIEVDSLIVPYPVYVDENYKPNQFSLSQNYPNPFNPATTISFSLPQESRVTLKIYNTLGEEIDTVSDAFYTAGTHTVNWDAGSVSSGLYFYRLVAGDFVETKKFMVLR